MRVTQSGWHSDPVTSAADEVVGSSADDMVAGALSAVADQPELSRLVLRVLQTGWSHWGMPTADLPDILSALTADSDSAVDAAAGVAPYLRAPSDDFALSYRRARAGKFDAFADLIGPHLPAGDVVDVGAGDVQLLERLKRSTGLPGEYLATDVAGEPCRHEEVAFVVQQRPDRLPVVDGQAQAVLATGMLHHVSLDARATLLAEMHRCLAPGGRVILVEDTYPGEPWHPLDDLDASFAALTDEQRLVFLAWTDWWGNRVMKNRPSEPLPCTFQDMSQWAATLDQAGFQRIEDRYLGLWHAGGHMATPRALMVWQKDE